MVSEQLHEDWELLMNQPNIDLTTGNFITPKGIPTPNLFNGGGNYHGRYEYVTVEQIDKLAEVLTMIITEHLRQSREGRDERPLEKYW